MQIPVILVSKFLLLLLFVVATPQTWFNASLFKKPTKDLPRWIPEEPAERPEPPLPWRRAGDGPHSESGKRAEEDEEEGGAEDIASAKYGVRELFGIT